MRPLWNHQVEAIRLAANSDCFGFLFEQGTGKSRACIETLRIKYTEHKRVLKTLILAPGVVGPNWKNEFKMYSNIPPHLITVLAGSSTKREAQLRQAMRSDVGHIVICNYETMQMKKVYALLMSWQPEVLVCDESQRIKNPQGVRARAVLPLADMADYRYILSGTPILNSPQDIFQQWRVLDRGNTFGKNFYAFRSTYFEDANSAWAGRQNHFVKWQPRKGAEEAIRDKIAKKSMRVLKKDCLDLPPLVRQKVEVELSAEQLKLYKQMYNDFIAFIDSQEGKPRTATAQLAITKALRMQQIVCGFLPVEQEDGDIHELKDVPRLEALAELLEQICIEGEHKTIVWSVFRHCYGQIAKICDKLGIKYTTIYGGMTHAQVQESIQKFTKSPDVKVMIANQKAGGVGINLVEASYSIYYSKNFSLEDDLQSEARNYRGGSEMHTSVTRIDLVSPGTIDEVINEALDKKQKVSEFILDWRQNF